MSMIAAELDIERKCRDGKAERVYYELTEMCSVELERFMAKKAQDEVILPNIPTECKCAHYRLGNR